MGLVYLGGIGIVIARAGEGRPRGRTSGVQSGSEEGPIDPVVLKVFVQTHVPLEAVAIVGRIENAAINDRHVARQELASRGSTSGRKKLSRRLTHAKNRSARRGIACEQLGPDGIRKRILRKRSELWILECDCRVSGGDRLTERLNIEKEEKLVLAPDRTANVRRHIVAMKGGIVVSELGTGPETLVAEVIAKQSMKLVGAGFGRHRHLDRARSAVVNIKSIDLDRGFRDSVGVRDQVDDARTDIAGNI